MISRKNFKKKKKGKRYIKIASSTFSFTFKNSWKSALDFSHWIKPFLQFCYLFIAHRAQSISLKKISSIKKGQIGSKRTKKAKFNFLFVLKF